MDSGPPPPLPPPPPSLNRSTREQTWCYIHHISCSCYCWRRMTTRLLRSSATNHSTVFKASISRLGQARPDQTRRGCNAPLLSHFRLCSSAKEVLVTQRNWMTTFLSLSLRGRWGDLGSSVHVLRRVDNFLRRHFSMDSEVRVETCMAYVWACNLFVFRDIHGTTGRRLGGGGGPQ